VFSHSSRIAEQVVFTRAAWLFGLFALLLHPQPLLAEAPSILIGLTAELEHPTNAAGQSIRAGIRTAIAEINAGGGALSGRPLELVERDDRGLPARGIDNFRELSSLPAMAGIFAGASVSLGNELVKASDSLKTPLMIPWVGADPDPVSESPARYVFRLAISERESLRLILNDSRQRGHRRIGLLLPSNAWGRRAAREAVALSKPGDLLSVIEPHWYESASPSLMAPYKAVIDRGADALILIMNESDSRMLLRELATNPEIPRLPFYLHWTAMSGRTALTISPEVKGFDLSVVHPVMPDSRQSAVVLERIAAQLPERYSGKVPVPAAALQAYDLTRLLAAAIARSGSGDRVAIRGALKNAGEYRGVLKLYRNPYAGGSQDALGTTDIAVFRLRSDGSLDNTRSKPRR
jgi:branched-chain amino acid transport system substrate-binding protein